MKIKNVKNSLLNDLTLLHKKSEFMWSTFSDIKHHVSNGFRIFNDQKRELYKKKYSK